MKGKILIVDDDPDVVDVLRMVLATSGYSTSSASSGEEALKTARRSPPDLILLDLILPGMNGFSVCEALRFDPMTASIPIVMLTALPGALPRLAGLEMGADAYVSKPFEITELTSCINGLLERRHGRQVPVDFKTPARAAA